MAKIEYPSEEEFAERIANKALDDFIYQGKTIREWVDILKDYSKREKGHWVPGGDFPLRCSQCRRGSVQHENFCMSCGADMRVYTDERVE